MGRAVPNLADLTRKTEILERTILLAPCHGVSWRTTNTPKRTGHPHEDTFAKIREYLTT